MNERINNLRLDAGISQLKDDPRLVVIDREGNVIDPLIGLEKFAELIVRECIGKYDEWAEHSTDKTSFALAQHNLKKHFGVE
jgi:hypothetical protein